MAKQYNIEKIVFNQKDYQKVAKYLSPGLKKAFLAETIDLEWCKTYCMPYVSHLIKNGQYNVGEEYTKKKKKKGKKVKVVDTKNMEK